MLTWDSVHLWWVDGGSTLGDHATSTITQYPTQYPDTEPTSPWLIYSGWRKGEWKKLVCLLLFYAMATVFLSYHGSDMMYEMIRRKPEPTCLPTQGIFNFSHHIGMVWEEQAFIDPVSYTQWGNRLWHSCYSCDRDSYPCPQGHIPRTLTNWANSRPCNEKRPMVLIYYWTAKTLVILMTFDLFAALTFVGMLSVLTRWVKRHVC